MNGFAGVVQFLGATDPAEWQNRIRRALESSGCIQIESKSDGGASLAVGRLATTCSPGPSSGLQDGLSCWLVFDGRLDNRDELKRRLGLDASRVADSALVAAAIERWGDAAASQLLGDFAYAAWDPLRRRATLVRDSGGMRTLFYHYRPGFLAFADTLSTLLRLKALTARLDEARLADVLLSGWPDDGATVWSDLAQVTPAGQAVADANGIRIGRYWQPDPERRIQLPSDDDYVDAASELLDLAVACRLPDQGKAVVMLSGGLDSSAVAVTAARRYAPERLTTLTSVPAVEVRLPDRLNQYADERPYVEAIAAMTPNLDAEFHCQPLHDPGPEVEAYFAMGGTPARNTMNMEWMHAATLRAQALGASVLLDGGMGNVTLSFDGLPGLQTLLREGRLLTLAREATAAARYLGVPMPRLLVNNIGGEALQPLVGVYRRLRGREPEHWNTWSSINPEFAIQSGAVRRHFEQRRDSPSQPTGDSRAQRIFADRRNARIRFMRSARRRLIGMDTCTPLADRRLFEFCLAIPDDQFLRNGRTRWLARRVLADRLPDRVIHNPMRGQQCPEWWQRLRAQHSQLIAQFERLEQSPLVRRCLDLPRLRKALMRAADEMLGPADQQAMLILHSSLHMGRYLLWVEQGQACPA